MLDVLGQAPDAEGFRARLPEALAVAKAAADRLRKDEVAVKDLGLLVQARMEVEEYRASTNTKAALARLRDNGTLRNPGEYVQYVVTRRSGPWPARAAPTELLAPRSLWFGGAATPYHEETYLRLLARSVETLLSPFGYTEENVLAWFQGRSPTPRPVPRGRLGPRVRPIWRAA